MAAWYKNRYVIAGGGAAALVLVVAWIARRRVRGSPGYPLPSYVSDARVTRTQADSEGWVQTEPAVLARRAGEALGLPGALDQEVYSLARAVGSEAGRAPVAEKVAIGWALVNRARERGWSITKLATYTSRFGNRGLYGTQEHGRVMATTRDPTGVDVYVATMILDGIWRDPTRGSAQFYSPRVQDILHQQWLRGERSTRYRSAAEIDAKWRSEGWERVEVAGVDPREQTFYRRAV